MNRRFFTLLMLGATLASVSAQDNPPTTVEVRMLAFTPDLQQKDVFAQDPAAKDGTPSVAAPIKTYLNHQFSTIPLLSRKLAFTTKADHASLTRPGEKIGEVTLPEKVNSAILVFLPGKEPGTSKIMVIDDSKRAFPAGSFHVTNISPLPVRLVLEQKTYEVPAGGISLIENPPVREGQMSGMRAFAQRGGTWETIATSLWPHPGRARGVKILYQNPTSGKIELRAFDDVPPREPAKPAGTR
jgi:hypothetical protein